MILISLIAGLAIGQAFGEMTLGQEPANANHPSSPTATPAPPPPPEPLRLTLVLTDGSQVVGVPSLTVLPVKTSFGDVQVPIDMVRSATFAKDHAEITLLMSNGDRLTGTPQMTGFKLNTLFGTVKIETRHVRDITVLFGGAVGQWPRDGLWGYWPLNGDAKDASGNGHDGIIRGATPCQGVSGQAFLFDGNASIEVGEPGFPTEEYTVAGWIRTEHPIQRDDYRTWIDQLDNSGGAFMVGLGDHRVRDGEKGMQYVVWAGEQGLVNIQASDINVRDGRWHHCAVTFEKGAQKLWVDGNLAATSNYDGLLPRTKARAAIGGHSFGSYHNPWIGDIDEVFIYERALNEQEILSLHQHGKR